MSNQHDHGMAISADRDSMAALEDESTAEHEVKRRKVQTDSATLPALDDAVGMTSVFNDASPRIHEQAKNARSTEQEHPSMQGLFNNMNYQNFMLQSQLLGQQTGQTTDANAAFATTSPPGEAPPIQANPFFSLGLVQGKTNPAVPAPGDTTNMYGNIPGNIPGNMIAMNPNFSVMSAGGMAPFFLGQQYAMVSAAPDPKLTGRAPTALFMACDDDSLSEYQCLVRRQIELFEAQRDDVESNAQGRNRPIVMGQVGIRCRHCRMLPPKHRARGAVYYPAKLQGLYQAAQNMASGHLCEHCQHVPAPLRAELLKLKERKSSAGGGKKYWADGVRVLGVREDEDGLRFEKKG